MEITIFVSVLRLIAPVATGSPIVMEETRRLNGTVTIAPPMLIATYIHPG